MANSKTEVIAMINENEGSKLMPLVISVITTVLFSFLSALPAAHYAAKVSPTVAIMGQKISIKRRNRKVKCIRNFEAFYARMNMKRNPGRTVITILSLVMSITVFIALESFSELLDASKDIQKMHLGDYSMTSEMVGFLPEDVTTLRNVPGIQAVSTLKYSIYQQNENGELKDIETSITLQPSESLQIIGIDEQRLISLASTLPELDLQELMNGTAALIQNPIPLSFGNVEVKNTVLSVGESISINSASLKVIGLLDSPITLENKGFINGIQVVVSDAVYSQLTEKSQYTELYPALAKEASRSSVEQSIQELCSQRGGTWLSYANTDKQLRESYEQIRLLAWGLILFIGFIGLLNIINTMHTNIHTRMIEIGVQRAIGMSSKSLYKTFLWEGAYYGIFASLIGSVLGYICSIFIKAAAANEIQLIQIPFLSIMEVTILSLMVCLTATYIPLIKIAKMNVVESIKFVE